MCLWGPPGSPLGCLGSSLELLGGGIWRSFVGRSGYLDIFRSPFLSPWGARDVKRHVLAYVFVDLGGGFPSDSAFGKAKDSWGPGR